MDLRLTMDTSELELWEREFPGSLRYALPYRINRTVERVMREKLFPMIERKFIIRGEARRKFFFGSADRPGGAAGKFPRANRATPDRLWAEFGIDSVGNMGGGSGRSGPPGPILLGGFERGAMRFPFRKGTGYDGQNTLSKIAVPLIGRPARPSIRGPVPPAFRVGALKLAEHIGKRKIVRHMRGGHVRGIGVFGSIVDESQFSPGMLDFIRAARARGLHPQIKGLQRTFMLHTGIFQRYERGTWDRSRQRTMGGIRMLYKFIPPFALDTRLHYEDTVRAEAPAIFREEMELAWQDAIHHAEEKLARRILGMAAA